MKFFRFIKIDIILSRMSSQTVIAKPEGVMSEEDQAKRLAEFREKAQYADRCAGALASALMSHAMRCVETACTVVPLSAEEQSEGKRERKSRPGCLLSLTEGYTYFTFGSPVHTVPKDGYDDRVMVFCNAKGEMFPQQVRPEGGFGELTGDSRRIPISQIVNGYDTKGRNYVDKHENLAERGIQSVLKRMVSLLNKELTDKSASKMQFSAYVSYVGNMRYAVHLVWDEHRFLSQMNFNARKRYDNGKGRTPTWTYNFRVGDVHVLRA